MAIFFDARLRARVSSPERIIQSSLLSALKAHSEYHRVLAGVLANNQDPCMCIFGRIMDKKSLVLVLTRPGNPPVKSNPLHRPRSSVVCMG